MPDMKQIHDFAVKWCDKFRDQNINYIDLVDHFMADDCAALGFEMDCGHAFSERYGQAANNNEALDRIIDDVTDIPLLGSAIYSQWRYFNHWAYDAAEILAPQNRAWFILALSRLALLSGENPFIFQGTLKKIRIVSNNICYGPMPDPDDEVEQHLTINDEGRVWFSGYNFGHSGERYEKARSKIFKIEKVATDRLLCAIAAYFGNEYDEIFATDIGNWEMELTNTEGTVYKFRGSLCADFDYEGIDLSDLVRDTVGMDDLYVFDGNCKPDVINRIALDYHREHLIIDRETETLEHIQNIGSGCKVSHKYEIEGGIESLLDDFDAEDLFSHIEGSYDKNGLPEDFADFAETVFDFIRFYGMGEIFDSSVYGKVKRRQSEYIFCSVTFDEGYKSYYYLTNDDSIEVGDFVIVPAGKDNHEAVVEVVNIEYFSEENVPLPI